MRLILMELMTTSTCLLMPILLREPNNLPFLSGPMENWTPLKIPPSLNPVLHLAGTSMFITREAILGFIGMWEREIMTESTKKMLII